MAEPDGIQRARQGSADAGEAQPAALRTDDDIGQRPAVRRVTTALTGARNGWPESRAYHRGAARQAWALQAIADAEREHGRPEGDLGAQRGRPRKDGTPAQPRSEATAAKPKRAAIDPARVAAALSS